MLEEEHLALWEAFNTASMAPALSTYVPKDGTFRPDLYYMEVCTFALVTDTQNGPVLYVG